MTQTMDERVREIALVLYEWDPADGPFDLLPAHQQSAFCEQAQYLIDSRAIASLPPAPVRGDVREAAQALVNKMDMIHEHPRYVSVWQSSHLHLGPYDGPKYEDELNSLRAALAVKE